MSTHNALTLATRAQSGTGPARATRREGFVPAILYGEKKEPVSLMIERRVLVKEMHTAGFRTKVFDLTIDGKVHRAIVRAVQVHPVTDVPLHIDFQRVSKTSKIHVQVPLKFLNEETCPGLKKGGVLSVMHPHVELNCSADHIPDHIDVELGTAEIGFALHMEDLILPAGVEFTHAAHNETLAAIVPPKVNDAADEAESSTEEKAEKEGAGE